jgi:hypothetical protein
MEREMMVLLLLVFLLGIWTGSRIERWFNKTKVEIYEALMRGESQ